MINGHFSDKANYRRAQIRKEISHCDTGSHFLFNTAGLLSRLCVMAGVIVSASIYWSPHYRIGAFATYNFASSWKTRKRLFRPSRLSQFSQKTCGRRPSERRWGRINFLS